MPPSESFSDRPLGDYAVVGNGHTLALVARNGSVDWCCWPRFDAPATFCRLIDARRGGSFELMPRGLGSAVRNYRDQTNVLETVWETRDGRARVTDFMPAPATEGPPIVPRHSLLRCVEGLSGNVELQVVFRPTFDYGRATTKLSLRPYGGLAESERESVRLTCPTSLRQDGDRLVGQVLVKAEERLWFTLSYAARGEAEGISVIAPESAEAELERTCRHWTRWSDRCTYRGPYHGLVRRSALTLKLLLFEPTGALVAAPTTSLPEVLGGEWNWDYRFTWLRDAGLTLDALQRLGYHDESLKFFDWLRTLRPDRSGALQIAYAVDGEPVPAEQTLDHLSGYRSSRPVRIGNAAAGQTQLDVFGHVLEAIFLCLERMPRPVDPDLWESARFLADGAAQRWSSPDRGPWETRGEPRHFLYSKLYCWVALDRALQLAERAGLPGDLDRWRQERELIRQAILTRGYNTELGAFTEAFEDTVLDASALVVPLVGFLPATDRRVISTVDQIQRRLTAGGLVRRSESDVLPSQETTFVLCSFWLVSYLARAGRVDEACRVFERITSYANDVGLLSEEIDTASGELLGNFPQGFAHLGLIRAACDIADTKAVPARRTEPSAR